MQSRSQSCFVCVLHHAYVMHSAPVPFPDNVHTQKISVIDWLTVTSKSCPARWCQWEKCLKTQQTPDSSNNCINNKECNKTVWRTNSSGCDNKNDKLTLEHSWLGRPWNNAVWSRLVIYVWPCSTVNVQICPIWWEKLWDKCQCIRVTLSINSRNLLHMSRNLPHMMRKAVRQVPVHKSHIKYKQ